MHQPMLSISSTMSLVSPMLFFSTFMDPGRLPARFSCAILLSTWSSRRSFIWEYSHPWLQLLSCLVMLSTIWESFCCSTPFCWVSQLKCSALLVLATNIPMMVMAQEDFLKQGEQAADNQAHWLMESYKMRNHSSQNTWKALSISTPVSIGELSFQHLESVSETFQQLIPLQV